MTNFKHYFKQAILCICMLHVAEIEGVTNPNLPLWFTKIALDFVHILRQRQVLCFSEQMLWNPHTLIREKKDQIHHPTIILV